MMHNTKQFDREDWIWKESRIVSKYNVSYDELIGCHVIGSAIENIYDGPLSIIII